MQTRKRAKSVSFGKKSNEKTEKEQVKKTVHEDAVLADSDKTSEKAAVVERRTVPEKPVLEGLSETPPNTEPEDASDVETPANEFVTDSPLSSTPELSKDTKEEPAPVSVEPEAASVEPEAAELSQPIEPAASAPDSPEQPAAQGESQELSSTLPPSAFTIQSNEPAPAPTPVPESGKKRFGVYFLVVAFLSFILGLGAMAAASYFGLVNVNLTRLPAGIHIPVMLGQKPTPTVPPPTAAPTQKPVDLTAFTIGVLNGSGIAGKAADEKTSLTTAGYKVTSTGNAVKSDFTKTEIAAKKTVDPAFLSKLEDELKKSFDVDATVASLPASSTTDVTVTLGQNTTH